MKHKLTRIAKTENSGHTRFEEYVGEIYMWPTIGSTFFLAYNNGMSVIVTSLIKEIINKTDISIEFKTETGSIYKVERLLEDQPETKFEI